MIRSRSHLAGAVFAAVATLFAGSVAASATDQASKVATAPTTALHACSHPALRHASCLAQFVPPATARSGAVAAASAAAPTSGYGPANIKSIYGIDTTRGVGQTVAIVDAYDDPNAAKDLTAYRAAWKLPPCTTASGCLRKVNQRGGTAAPAGDPGWGLEISLDLDAVSAACPRCKILLVEADSSSVDDLGTAVNEAVRLGAKIVSNSYGADEFNGVIALGTKYYSHPGVAMVVSSGDNGFGPAGFPADWARSIAVGGTSVTKTANGWAHTAWAGAGSGCSAWVAKPAWQKDAHCLMRTVADVSALADPATGLAVYDTYQLPANFGVPNGWVVVGGTSLAAPLVAGMIGLAGNAATLDTAQSLYTHSSSLRDVSKGSNGFCGGDYLCTALKGYDGPTGNGTPRGLGAL